MINLLAISTELLGSIAPQFGRTQYFFGAVVLILNKTFLSVGFLRLMCDVTGCVNGPESNNRKVFFYYLQFVSRCWRVQDKIRVWVIGFTISLIGKIEALNSREVDFGMVKIFSIQFEIKIKTHVKPHPPLSPRLSSFFHSTYSLWKCAKVHNTKA